MKKSKQIHRFIILVIVCFVGSVPTVNAQAWLDFSQIGQWTLNGDNNLNLKKSATCPKNGYLLVTGTGSIGGYYSSPRFVYSLTRDNTPPFEVDYAHYGVISLDNDPGKTTSYGIPFSIQRVDACRAGQTIPYRLIGILEHGYAGEWNYVLSPTLVIQFFDTLI